MSFVHATWKNGQIVLDVEVDWPEGRRLVVGEETAAEIKFMTENEQNDDPAAIQQWIDELRALPPVPWTTIDEIEHQAWQEKMEAFNLEAVQDQMKKGIK